MIIILKSFLSSLEQLYNIILFFYNFYYLNKNINNLKLFDYYSDKLIKNIDIIGIVAIKIVQWSLDRIRTIYEKDIDINIKIINKFNKYYENCNIHDFEYTKKIYYNDFNRNIEDDFDIDVNPIASGSIGQVYKGWYKNKLNNNEKIKVAIKVVHPDVKSKIWLPKMFLLLFDYMSNKFNFFNKYRSIININHFFKNLENQINLIFESKNMVKMKKLYKNNLLIIVPKLYCNSSNIIIMSYEDGTYYEDLNLSEYQKYKIIGTLRLFLNSSVIVKNFVHTDLHNGNWKVRKHISKNIFHIVLLDFGLCSYMENADDINIFHECIENNDIIKLSQNLLKYVKIPYGKHITTTSKLIKYFNDKTLTANIIMKYMNENNLLIEYNFFNIIITSLICRNHFKKYLIKDSKDDNSLNDYSYIIPLITICKTYNCFNEYCKILEKKLKNVKNLYNFNNENIINIDNDSDLEVSDSD
jgi:hypothetical protein